jgi:RNA polymerase primary sigma factor
MGYTPRVHKELAFQIPTNLPEPTEDLIKLFESSFLPELDNIDISDSIALQRASIPVIPKKDRAQSIALGKRIEAGRNREGKLNSDACAARDELIFSCTGLNFQVAKRYTGRGVPLADLFQEGFIGLQVAAEKYDWRKGYIFGTYAFYWLMQVNQRAVSKESGVPAYIYQLDTNLERFKEGFSARKGRDPSPEEIFQGIGIKPNMLRNLALASKMKHPKVFSELAQSWEEDKDPVENIKDSSAPYRVEVEDRIDKDRLLKHVKDVINRHVSQLPPREARVVRLRLGIDDKGKWSETGKTLSEIADMPEFKVSITRITQLQSQALKKIKNHDLHKILNALLRD